MNRVPCRVCGESIHPDTAAKNDGRCMPCKGGYRANIEAGKRRREADRLYEQSAERKHWVDLVDRAYRPGGVDSLKKEEKTYFAVSCLIGEVHNGGFEQFFFNSSGSMYAHALDGLMELEADEAAALLVRAKDLLFDASLVPVDTGVRRACLRSRRPLPELEALDKEFWREGESLGKRCRQYALHHGLYKDA